MIMLTIIELLQTFYKKNEIQYNDYKSSSYTARIRLKSNNKYKLQKENVIKNLYLKLEKGLSGLEFVESFYAKDYERYMEELSGILNNDEMGVSIEFFNDINEDSEESVDNFDENLSEYFPSFKITTII